MPLLATSGDRAADAVAVYTAMCWPHEPQLRRQYQLHKRLLRQTGKLPGDELVQLTAEDIRTLLQSPPAAKLEDDAEEAAKQGYVAGDVLLSMYLMDRFSALLPPTGSKGASLSKAFWVAKCRADNGRRFGNGDEMPAATKTVQKRWTDFRGVAHFWAAHAFLIKMWPVEEVRSASFFPTFMSTASFFFDFGASFLVDNRGSKVPTPLLHESVSLVVNPRQYPARLPAEISLPTDGADPLLDWFGKSDVRLYLREYAAENDRSKGR